MAYSLHDSQALVKYYSTKMVGEYLDKEKQFKIQKIKADKLNNNEYLVRACGQRDSRGMLLFKEISQIAKQLNLPSPDEVLSDLNRNQ